ncbi:MAG: 2OG-Fe(II) oxygenase [Comamonas sp.]
MSQTATPELQQWIRAQTEAGQPRAALQASMEAAGWLAPVAARALDETLGAQAGESLRAEGDTPGEPGPDLSSSPLVIDAGDRRVHVLARLEQPRIVVFGDLLDAAECAALIEAARPRMARSLTVATLTGGEEVNDDRTSSGMFFARAENEVVRRIEARIARLLRWPVENGEGLQVLRYGVGAEYKPHYDYFDPHEPGTPRILARGGQRVATVVIYLNEPEQGGGTTFPDIGLEVAPRRGQAVFFSYPRPDPSSRTLHGGAPVIAGEKWIATKWLRVREFN